MHKHTMSHSFIMIWHARDALINSVGINGTVLTIKILNLFDFRHFISLDIYFWLYQIFRIFLFWKLGTS